jgi:hypothetical protein
VKDLLLVAAVVIFYGHGAASIAYQIFRWPAALGASRALCALAIAGYVVALFVATPHGADWIGAVTYPIWWWLVHRLLHKDGHGRRLRDAATGWVRRFGNRLVVVPAAGGAR